MKLMRFFIPVSNYKPLSKQQPTSEEQPLPKKSKFGFSVSFLWVIFLLCFLNILIKYIKKIFKISVKCIPNVQQNTTQKNNKKFGLRKPSCNKVILV